MKNEPQDIIGAIDEFMNKPRKNWLLLVVQIMAFIIGFMMGEIFFGGW